MMAGPDTVVVIGLGRFGAAAALGLARRGADVPAIDIDEHVVQRVADELAQVVCADGTDLVALKQLGVAPARHVVIAFSSKVEDSLLCALALAELEIPQIWASAGSSSYAKVLQSLGAQHILMPPHDAARHTAQQVGGRRQPRIHRTGSDFALATATAATSPRLAATLTETGVLPGLLVAVKVNGRLSTWRAGDPVPSEGTLLIAGPTEVVENLTQGGHQL